MNQDNSKKARTRLRITRYRKTRYWAIWENDELLTVTVYLKGARSILTKITTMKENDKPGLIVPATDRDGAKVRLMVTASDKSVTYISRCLKGEFVVDDSIEQSLPELLDESIFFLTTAKGEQQVSKFFAEKQKAKRKKSAKAKAKKAKRIESKPTEQVPPWLVDEPEAAAAEQEAAIWQEVEAEREREAQESIISPEEASIPTEEETEHPAVPATKSRATKARQVILPGDTTPQPIPADFVITPGCRLLRSYKGRTIEVEMVSERQFRWEDEVYPTLTHISWKVAGYQVAGTTFFGLPIKHR